MTLSMSLFANSAIGCLYARSWKGQRTLLGRTNSAVASWNGYVNAVYDAGQLTHAWTYLPDGTPVASQQWSYGYDAAQNLAKRTNNTTVETFAVNALNQLTAVPDSTPSYDRRGNLTQRYFPAGPQYYWTYTYDVENQLASVATDTYYTYDTYRFKVEFTYDGQGRLRVRKDYTWSAGAWVLGTESRYVYDGMLLVQERDGSNTPTVTYTRGRDLSGNLQGAGGIGGLLARSHGYSGGNWSTHNFYHADGNGNVTALVNSSGTLQASYKYDPYGRYLGQSGALATANVLRFSSKPWMGFNGSTTSGLYAYGYRFYDPYLQRWLTRDPIGEPGFEAQRRWFSDVLGDGPNRYTYLNNAPVSSIDSYGLGIISACKSFWWKIIHYSEWVGQAEDMRKKIKDAYDAAKSGKGCAALDSVTAHYCNCFNKYTNGSNPEAIAQCICAGNPNPDCEQNALKNIKKVSKIINAIE